MQGLYDRLTRGFISLLYIHMQCSGIQGIYDQVDQGVHVPPIYICSVLVFKASMID